MVLQLLKVTEADLPQIMEWRMMQEVTKYMYTDPVLTLEKQQVWWQSVCNQESMRHWMIVYEGVKIGLFNFNHIDWHNHRCDWGYYIGNNSFRGRGIASTLERNMYDYAFERLNLNKSCCQVLSFNESVVALHQKCGAVIEGVFHQHIYKNGQYHDLVCMAITKERWNQIRTLVSYDQIEIEE